MHLIQFSEDAPILGPMSQGKMSKVDKSRQNIPKLRQVAQPFRKVAQT